MKVALDTNILIYAEGLQGETRRDETLHLLRTLAAGALVVPVQVLGEVFNVLVRKAGRTRAEAAAVVAAWSDAAETQDTGADVMVRALDLARDHQFGIWDAVILAAAATAGCRLLCPRICTTASPGAVSPFSTLMCCRATPCWKRLQPTHERDPIRLNQSDR